MQEAMGKDGLLELVQQGYAEFEALLAPLSEEQVTTTGVTGEWSIKDVLAHLSEWHLRLLNILQASQQGIEPNPPLGLDDEEMDTINARFYENNKALPLQDVQARFRTTYRQVVETIQAMSNEALTVPNYRDWQEGFAIWQFVEGNTYGHYQEHEGPIRTWLAEGARGANG